MAAASRAGSDRSGARACCPRLLARTACCSRASRRSGGKRFKSSGSTPSDGSNTEEKDSLRAQRTSSVVDFLDAFEEASAKFPKPRHLVGDTKAKAKQRDQNFWPGMLLSDYDWSENGIIALARQIQSEYWSLTSFSLFI